MSAFTRKDIEAIVDERLRRIFEAGMMYAQPAHMETSGGTNHDIPQNASIPKPPESSPKNTLTWKEMPAPKAHPENGPWQKCEEIEKPELQAIISKLDGNNFPQDINGHRYWLLREQGTNIIQGVGRRTKT